MCQSRRFSLGDYKIGVVGIAGKWSTEALADGVAGAVDCRPELLGGVNVAGGAVANPAVADSLGVECVDARTALGL